MADVIGEEDAKVFGRSEVAGFIIVITAQRHDRNLLLSDWSKKSQIEQILKMRQLTPTLDAIFMILSCILFWSLLCHHVPLQIVAAQEPAALASWPVPLELKIAMIPKLP